ncbi:MAG TPA: hypothetical protein VGL44_07550 [Gaiellales bacterium]|jgi:hypothetical protein
MRPRFEVVLPVLVLVALPLGVLAVARSERSPAPPPSALAVATRLLGSTTFAPAACRWNADHSVLLCSLEGGGRCRLDLRRKLGSCTRRGARVRPGRRAPASRLDAA